MISNVRKGAEVSVGVNSKEELLRFKLFDKDTCFVILVSLIAIILCENVF